MLEMLWKMGRNGVGEGTLEGGVLANTGPRPRWGGVRVGYPSHQRSLDISNSSYRVSCRNFSHPTNRKEYSL